MSTSGAGCLGLGLPEKGWTRLPRPRGAGVLTPVQALTESLLKQRLWVQIPALDSFLVLSSEDGSSHASAFPPSKWESGPLRDASQRKTVPAPCRHPIRSRAPASSVSAAAGRGQRPPRHGLSGSVDPGGHPQAPSPTVTTGVRFHPFLRTRVLVCPSSPFLPMHPACSSQVTASRNRQYSPKSPAKDTEGWTGEKTSPSPHDGHPQPCTTAASGTSSTQASAPCQPFPSPPGPCVAQTLYRISQPSSTDHTLSTSLSPLPRITHSAHLSALFHGSHTQQISQPSSTDHTLSRSLSPLPRITHSADLSALFHGSHTQQISQPSSTDHTLSRSLSPLPRITHSADLSALFHGSHTQARPGWGNWKCKGNKPLRTSQPQVPPCSREPTAQTRGCARRLPSPFRASCQGWRRPARPPHPACRTGPPEWNRKGWPLARLQGTPKPRPPGP
uniref:leucine-rich repeat extensin-like protein 5 n=1 Tax=Macaca mulatta TaxID=9544 RepID=UPI0010A29E3E|nr:leucine-rich repeat extensin-like protein 5 [Macaca mulatta]